MYAVVCIYICMYDACILPVGNTCKYVKYISSVDFQGYNQRSQKIIPRFQRCNYKYIHTHTLPTCTSPYRATLVTIDSGTKRERSAKSKRLLILVASFLNSSCVSDCSFTFSVCTSPSAAVYLEREGEAEREGCGESAGVRERERDGEGKQRGLLLKNSNKRTQQCTKEKEAFVNLHGKKGLHFKCVHVKRRRVSRCVCT